VETNVLKELIFYVLIIITDQYGGAGRCKL